MAKVFKLTSEETQELLVMLPRKLRRYADLYEAWEEGDFMYEAETPKQARQAVSCFLNLIKRRGDNSIVFQRGLSVVVKKRYWEDATGSGFE